jgi:predicted dehydrogenase
VLRPDRLLSALQVSVGRWGKRGPTCPLAPSLQNFVTESLRVESFNPPPLSLGRLPEEAPASSLTATGIHVLDAMIRLFGPVAGVSATTVSQPPPDEALDALTMVFRFARPMSAVLCGVRPTPLFWRLHVFGRDGSVEAIGDREVVIRLSGQPIRRLELQPVNGMRLQMEAFAAAVASRAHPTAWPIPPATAGCSPTSRVR